MTRARYPDHVGRIDDESVPFGYEVFGGGDPTILLMPTWTIIHSRFWKFQVPYLSRFYRVVTYDGPGNGSSPRSTDPADYAVGAYVERARRLLDELGVESAVLVGYSDGGKMAAAFGAEYPDRVRGLVLIAPNLAVTEPSPDRAQIARRFLKPYPPNPSGWEKYNASYWEDNYEDFIEFFFSELFSETYTTKAKDDAIGWARETNGAVLKAEALRPNDPDHFDVVARIHSPTLLVHGIEDRLIPASVGQRLAELTGGSLLEMKGTGHAPHMKEPVRFNLALRKFVEGLAV